MKKKSSLLLVLLTILTLFCAVPQVQAAVKLSKKTLVVTVGSKATLKVKGTTKKASWSTSNKKIATVTQKGVVTGLKAGTAKITAKIGTKKYTCAVTVSPKIKYTSYKDPSGYFTASIPSGWKVKVGIMGRENMPIDIISYGIRVYDPKNTDRCVYMCLNCVGLASESARENLLFYYKWYGDPTYKDLADSPIISDVSTKGFFTAVQSLMGMKSFSAKNLGKASTGGNILLGTATSKASGKKVKGLCSAFVTAGPATYVSAYSIVMERARSAEFASWQPILDHVLGSIKFTGKFQDDRKKQWETVMGTAAYMQANGDAMSEIIMKAWNKQMQ